MTKGLYSQLAEAETEILTIRRLSVVIAQLPILTRDNSGEVFSQC
jgi:hypothetical protein